MHEGTCFEIGPCASEEEVRLVCVILKGVKRWPCVLLRPPAVCCAGCPRLCPLPRRYLPAHPLGALPCCLCQPRRQACRMVQQAMQALTTSCSSCGSAATRWQPVWRKVRPQGRTSLQRLCRAILLLVNQTLVTSLQAGRWRMLARFLGMQPWRSCCLLPFPEQPCREMRTVCCHCI